MRRRLPTLIAAFLLAAALGAGHSPAALGGGRAAAASDGGHSGAARAQTGLAAARGFAASQIVVKFAGERFGRAVPLPPGVGVRAAAAALRDNPRVAYATPNYIASISAAGAAPGSGGATAGKGKASAASESEVLVPNDTGQIDPGGLPGGWVAKQWNFMPWAGSATALVPTSPGGIDAVGAWKNLEEAGRPGAAGVTVAVLDTGIAYRALGSRFRRSPDFTARQFVPGYDFVEKDRLPLDKNGHGTHVAGTIAEKTDNGIALTGLAYRAKLMPVRVLNRQGEGRASVIAKGIRFAVSHHADVINMSFNFECGKEPPILEEALRYAYRKGVVTVASVGNRFSEECVAPPATGPRVIGVGGTTQGGCIGDYSLAGKAVDLVAPGGGRPRGECPSLLVGSIYQVTFQTSTNPLRFGEPPTYAGTSMAAAHVSGVAAMVIASGVVGRHPSPEAVQRRLQRTARSIGAKPNQQGAGLIDAGRATELAPKGGEQGSQPATNPPKAAEPVADSAGSSR
ncbi:MAG TPA: S8 family serine peptidase [Solirubrobacterales bacterium]|nr:S8 family serine peptidase [Solirubrobacterales bacterium]